MRILAIDTALGACSAAILDTAQSELVASEELPMARGHAEALVPMLAALMKSSGAQFSQFDRVAVTTGPGSFTGLRVGLAAARGIALAIGKPAVGLSTLAAYVAPLVASDPSRPAAIAIDARHSHVYFQMFEAGGRASAPPQVLSLDDAAALASSRQPRLAGNAAHLVAARMNGSAVASDIDTQPFPAIAWVARLAATADPDKSPARPLYLRAPDAQPQDAAQLPRR